MRNTIHKKYRLYECVCEKREENHVDSSRRESRGGREKWEGRGGEIAISPVIGCIRSSGSS